MQFPWLWLLIFSFFLGYCALLTSCSLLAGIRKSVVMFVILPWDEWACERERDNMRGRKKVSSAISSAKHGYLNIIKRKILCTKTIKHHRLSTNTIFRALQIHCRSLQKNNNKPLFAEDWWWECWLCTDIWSFSCAQTSVELWGKGHCPVTKPILFLISSGIKARTMFQNDVARVS